MLGVAAGVQPVVAPGIQSGPLVSKQFTIPGTDQSNLKFTLTAGSFFSGAIANFDASNIIDAVITSDGSQAIHQIPANSALILKNQRIDEIDLQIDAANSTATGVKAQINGRAQIPTSDYERLLLEADSDLFFRLGISGASNNFSAVNSNYSTLTDSGANSGIIFQSVPAGSMNIMLALWSEILMLQANLSAIVATSIHHLQISLRDATVQPTVTVAQFIASTPNTFAKNAAGSGVAATGITIMGYGGGGDRAGSNSDNTSWVSLFGAGTAAKGFVRNAPAFTLQKVVDDYGNTLALGDALVLDVGLWADKNKANFTGTFSALMRWKLYPL